MCQWNMREFPPTWCKSSYCHLFRKYMLTYENWVWKMNSHKYCQVIQGISFKKLTRHNLTWMHIVFFFFFGELLIKTFFLLIKYNIGNAHKLRDLYLFSHFDSLKFRQIVAEFNLGFHDVDLFIYCPTQEISFFTCHSLWSYGWWSSLL